MEKNCYEIRIILTQKGLSCLQPVEPGCKISEIFKELSRVLCTISEGLQPSESQAAFRKTGTTKPGQGSYPKEDQEDIHPSLDNITEEGQEQARTPPVLGLALAIAEYWELNLTQQEVFINFMAARFPEETDWEYIDTWASRFHRKVEVAYCDNLSAAKMLEIVKTLKGETKLFPIGCI